MRRSTMKNPTRKETIERIALKLYDILNPDHRNQIVVSKAMCLEFAEQCLDVAERYTKSEDRQLAI